MASFNSSILVFIYSCVSSANSHILQIFDCMDIIYHEFDSPRSVGNNYTLQKLLNHRLTIVYNNKNNEHLTPYRKKGNLLPL